jgi:hypothetical protein
MVERVAPILVISFVLLAARGAVCQSERPSVDSFQGLRVEGSHSPEVQGQKMRTLNSLPDSPSVQLQIHEEKFQTFIDQMRSPSPLARRESMRAYCVKQDRTTSFPERSPVSRLSKTRH